MTQHFTIYLYLIKTEPLFQTEEVGLFNVYAPVGWHVLSFNAKLLTYPRFAFFPLSRNLFQGLILFFVSIVFSSPHYVVGFT